MKRVLGGVFVIPLGVCLAVGCAEGEEADFAYGRDADGRLLVDAGPAVDAASSSKVVVADAGTPPAAEDDELGDDDFLPVASTSPGTSELCQVSACRTAKAQPSISGDQGGSRFLRGAASQWFTLDVTENNENPVFGQPLRLLATLTSPPGKNFDLFVYLPESGGGKSCSVGERASERAVGDDQVSLAWGEVSWPNGVADDRTVTVEVREIVDATLPTGTCDPTATWSLTLEGNK